MKVKKVLKYVFDNIKARLFDCSLYCFSTVALLMFTLYLLCCWLLYSNC